MATPARGRSLSLPQQAFGLRSLFPDSHITLRGRKLTWVGDLYPTELSQRYRTRIDYPLGQYPTVRIIDPPITKTHQRVPHVYRDGTLCVHDVNDWNPRLHLADTIVAWTLEWLFFWELFLATGTWYGDGPSANRSESSLAQNLPPLGEHS
jgi:hypothetical protein